MTVKSSPRATSIVIPVYGDWPSLSDCLDSLLRHLNFNDGHTVILVNDCGPDADTIERNILRKIKGKKGFAYFRNPHNLGFVGTCNRAVFELDNSTRDVLLLNSDTIVTKGFLEKLRLVFDKNNKIGAVSPRSNNATIATIPMSEMKNRGINPETSYRLYENIKEDLPLYTISPVSHGFCMLVRRNLIEKFGLFDPIFGKGYGEETDFCMRIRRKGYFSALCNHSFVFHMEARSFSLETKRKLIEANDKIMVKRYPNYHYLVRDYIDNQADIVDRFSHLLGDTSQRNVLIDVRGLQKEPKNIQSEIIRDIEAFLGGGQRLESSLLTDENTFDPFGGKIPTIKESRLSSHFFLVYRPFSYSSVQQLFIINRYGLKLMYKKGASKGKVINLIKKYWDPVTYDSTNSPKEIGDLVTKLLIQPINSSLLRARWAYIHSLESRFRLTKKEWGQTKSFVKHLVSKNDILFRSARFIKTRMGR